MMTNDLSSRLVSLPPEESSILCAVSGGADSMCLLHLLHTCRTERNFRICAAHYEHGIRGEESLRDLRFVEEYCRIHEIPFIAGHGNVPETAAENGRGIEETARELRYAFLESAAEQLGCSYIATAHNADDNAETILLHLTRGAGAAGLRGIPEQRGRILRPLLRITRAEIEAYLAEREIPFVEDSSNGSDDYTRNRIRRHVMPVLREINPNFTDAAAGTAELLRRDNDLLEQMADDFLRQNQEGIRIPTEQFRKLHPAVAGRVVRKLCPRSLTMEQVDRVIAMAGGGSRTAADLPGLRVIAERGILSFGEEEILSIPPRILRFGEPLDIPEAGLRIRSKIITFTKEINNSFKTYVIKYENIEGSVLATGRRSGDRLRPKGRKCSKTLKQLFLEQKLTEREKQLTPVLRDDRGILLVHGLAVDERCTAEPGDMVLTIQIEQLTE